MPDLFSNPDCNVSPEAKQQEDMIQLQQACKGKASIHFSLPCTSPVQAGI
jgi:hypothetical protein